MIIVDATHDEASVRLEFESREIFYNNWILYFTSMPWLMNHFFSEGENGQSSSFSSSVKPSCA